MSLITQIDQDIKQAMLAKQADRLRGLRAINQHYYWLEQKKVPLKKLRRKSKLKCCRNS